MTTLEQMAKQQIKKNSLDEAIEQTHKRLKTKITTNWEQDKQIANDLSIFLTKIFSKRKKKDCDNEIQFLKGILTEDLANDLKSKMGLEKGAFSTWQEFEKRIGTALEGIVNAAFEDYSKKETQIFKGEDKSTVQIDLSLVPKTLRDIVFDKIKDSYKGHFVQDENDELIFYYNEKYAKNDAYIITTGVDTNDSRLKALMDLSASIKNYGINQKLELVNETKAFMALMNFMQNETKISRKHISTLWSYYARSSSGLSEIYKHLAHIKKIFALTGLGAVYANDKTIKVNSRFFIYRTSAKASTIKVLSTKDILNKILEDLNVDMFGWDQELAKKVPEKYRNQIVGQIYFNPSKIKSLT